MKVSKSFEKLAVFGGKPVIEKAFKRYNPIGQEELEAAKKVIESGVLSKFLGCWDPDFLGGPKVQEFERAAESYFGVKHSVTVNSWTSGLIAAVGSIEIEPGDEIIVSPWTMCASATAILHWNAIPVFADIDPMTFCIDPESIEANISPYTKAIMSIDIFGQPADMDRIEEVAKKNDLRVISDTAQAPGAIYKGRLAGTLADVGGYSLNYHKHIHTGEGGILVTDNDEIADRLRLIRNHAEAVVGDKGVTNLRNMIGFNFRLGEIESAIGIEQLKKLEALVGSRQKSAEKLTSGLKDLDGLMTPHVMPGCTHVYYVYPIIIDIEFLGVERDKIYDALIAEGVQGLIQGYSNIHLLPMYQRKIAYGANGFPWTSEICKRDVYYRKGICPVSELLHDKKFIGMEMCQFDFSDQDVDSVIEAFQKVWNNLDQLR